MAVEYDISSDVAVIKETGSVSQCARVTQMYSGQITYDDEAGSKFATATINGKSQRVMLCIAVSGTVTYDDVPSLYSTVDGHRCLNIVTPTETGTPDDVPSLYETVVIDGQNVRAVRCIMINKTPVYDGVSSTCTFTGDDGKTHTAQLVNKVTGGSVVVIIKGTSPLNLPDAIANSLQYVKAFGGTEQNGTPTPDAPVDIVSNNGVLKARHQSGLPLGYTRLEYIESNGTQYIDLGYKGNGNTKVEVKFKYHTATGATGSGRVFGSRTTSSSNAFAIGSASGVVSATGNKVFWCYDAQSFFVIDDPTFPIGDWQTVVFSAAEHTLNGVSYGDDYNVVEFETPQNLKLFGFDNNGTMGYGQVDIAYCKLWGNGVLIRDLVPAENSSNVIGMYDLVSGQFFTNQGTGTFTAGNPVSDPVEIYTDGTVETIKDSLNNTATAEMLLKIGNYQDEQEILSGAVTRNVGVRVFDGTEAWGVATTSGVRVFMTNFIGGYQYPLICTHFINGEPTTDNIIYIASGTQVLHIRYDTAPDVAGFKQWLAEQYAAGTPVILVYPLATPTTESVTGQALQVTAGDNVLEITQASLSGLELEAKYSKNS